MLLLHRRRDLQGSLHPRALLTGAAQGVVSYVVGHQALLLHRRGGLQGSLWALALFSSADQGIVGECIGHNTLLRHHGEEFLGMH